MAKEIKIIIAGAGFAGLSCALRLGKLFRGQREVRIILIDRRDYHLYTPNLYEAASSEEELVSISQLKKSLVLPIQEVIFGTPIEFVRGEIKSVDQDRKRLTAGMRELEYDYLVLAFGSGPDYLNISGAEEYALPLANLKDALRIRNSVEFTVQAHRLDARKRTIKFVVAGGGCAGVGFAGELPGLLDFISWKNSYPRERLQVLLLEASSKLLPGFPEKAGQDACLRLKELGVQTEFGKLITAVTPHMVEFISGERMEYDVLIWTAGKKAVSVPFRQPVFVGRKGRIQTDEFLRLNGSDSVFVVGDLGENKNREMAGIDRAEQEGEYVADALQQFFTNKKPKPFTGKAKGRTINIGDKWAISTTGKIFRQGLIAYYLGYWEGFCYYRSLLGLTRAFKIFFRQGKIFSRNN